MDSLDKIYPNIAFFTEDSGIVEFGRDDSGRTSFIRALDLGGMVWEGADSYESLDAAFQDLERGLGEWMEEVGLTPEG